MARKSLEVVVIGGSLAGLMHGIMFKRLGHNVRILEQYPTSTREGQAAGMSTGVYGQEFLGKHDRIEDRPHFVSASYLRILDVELNLTELRPVPFKLTNWKTIYYRLRANFDGLSSDYVPNPPPSQQTDGTVVYETGKRVRGISYDKKSGTTTVTFENIATGESLQLHPDMIIAADGANSTVRKLLFPELENPYAGFLTWRGVIPETYVSNATLKFLDDNAIRYWTDNGYIVVYLIPGENGSNTIGERDINLVWYDNCPKNSSNYKSAMTDIDGVQHQRTVPFGKVHPDVWTKQIESSSKFAVPIKEIIEHIDKPFVTAISDCISPKCSFFEGKLFLVGDALALFRPHVAQSTNQSALHCLLLEKLLQDKIDLGMYEQEAMMYAHTTRLWSREVGSQYLHGPIGQMYHKARFRLAQEAKRWGMRL